MIFSLERSTHCCFYSEAITGFKPLSSKTSGISDRIFCEKCGLSKARVFQDAKILLCGREGTFECLELPCGRNPLIGVIPLEALGLELDLQNQTLKVLSSKSLDTYLTIL